MTLKQLSIMLFLRAKLPICHRAVCSSSVFCLWAVFCSIHPAVVNRSGRRSTEPRSMRLSAFQSLPACIGTNRPSSLYERTASTHKQPFVCVLHSLLAFPQDKLTRLQGSVRGLCVLVDAWNLKPSSNKEEEETDENRLCAMPLRSR